jgi:diaminopimelate epimerase
MMDAMSATDDRLAERKGLAFAKGHGTGNDFVIVPDPHGELPLPPDVVAALCDRRFGIGGDGVLRVVRTVAEPAVREHAGEAEWFMDYRNADGSLAEMCGNGVRVYARYLVESGLAAGPEVAILTRAGRVVARVDDDVVAVDMPVPQVLGAGRVGVGDTELTGTVAICGNPNLVCRVDDPTALDLSRPLRLDPALFPAGANVEFLAAGASAVTMRVVERGVGETLSCGSGACAAAAVVLADAGDDEGEVAIDVPGGRLVVTLTGGRCVLTGPAVIVATGTLTLPLP